MDKNGSSKNEPVGDDKRSKDEEAFSSDEEDFSDYDSDDYLDEEEAEEEEEELSPEALEEAGRQREERRQKRREEEAKKKDQEDVVEENELWNFPVDRENWTEADLGEVWADYWGDTTAVGYDPELVDKVDIEHFDKLRSKGKGPPNTPYYVPYRKFYPSIPDNHFDIQTPEDAVEELERMEEFLVWVSYVFKDGSSYEGTVWDDLAHGKGVYTTPLELCRYEGEWFQNMMQGHGVLEVDVPVYEPTPDSQEAKKMKAKGAILKSDYLDPFDREWLKMDIQDTVKRQRFRIVPFEDRQSWVDNFGEKPEKGHYKYSGQWKHSRMHGCGVFEINSRLMWGKFYFGELLPDHEECTVEMSAFHSSMAEVAAAKAKMFVNKPDGMVREIKGPYTDPSHPYMYEEEDLWMAPGFINAYYEVPQEWTRYVEDLDTERELWLNSFYHSPLRIPMPPELEYWWSQDDEFVVLTNTSSSSLSRNPDNVGREKEELQGDVLLHVPTGNIINWTHDEEGRLRFFLQPITKDGQVNIEDAIPFPLGYDEYFESETEQTVQKAREKKNIFQRFSETWKKYSEEHEQERRQRIENLENRWKEEDRVREERQKLKAAERKLALEIEEEKLYAHYQEILDAAAAMKAARDQSSEAVQDQSEDGAEAKIEELEEAKGDTEKPPEAPEGTEQDDEDDKKPRSFGKVAMVDIPPQKYVYDVKGKLKEPGPASPTAFASLSLAPKMVVHEVLQSKFCRAMAGLLLKPTYRQCQTRSDIEQKFFDQASSPSVVSHMKVHHVKFLSCCKELGLKVSCANKLYAGKSAHRSILKTELKATCPGAIGGRKHRMFIKRCGWANSMNRDSSCQQDKKNAWSKPEYGFLSMAVPVKM